MQVSLSVWGSPFCSPCHRSSLFGQTKLELPCGAFYKLSSCLFCVIFFRCKISVSLRYIASRNQNPKKALIGLTLSIIHTIVSNKRMTEMVNTKTKVLDVAEKLFGEHGLDRVSVRDITNKAKVNLAAISYHFGSKQDLIAAVFERRIFPVNEARLMALDAVEKSAGKKAPKLEDILEAFIRPTLQCSQKASEGGAAFSKLFGRCLSEPSPEVETLLKKQFEPLAERLDRALMRALPKLSRTEIFWRMKFTFGALHHWLLTKDRFIPHWIEASDIEEQVQTLISYSAAGFRGA
ncbi:MAG: transcriptional regulator, TetR family [Pedosphaera sp.]|nr:transcriptional regulator, TetR family [Pedosphaera sp.]